MSKLKSTVFIACLIFSLAEFCLGDTEIETDIEEIKNQMKNMTEQLQEERRQLKAQRRKDNALLGQAQAAVQNFESLDVKVQKNLNEYNETITELQNTVQNFLNTTVQNYLNESASAQTVYAFIVLILFILIPISTVTVAFIWLKRKDLLSILGSKDEYDLERNGIVMEPLCPNANRLV